MGTSIATKLSTFATTVATALTLSNCSTAPGPQQGSGDWRSFSVPPVVRAHRVSDNPPPRIAAPSPAKRPALAERSATPSEPSVTDALFNEGEGPTPYIAPERRSRPQRQPKTLTPAQAEIARIQEETRLYRALQERENARAGLERTKFRNEVTSPLHEANSAAAAAKRLYRTVRPRRN
jgi:hypothetical protein